jgi:hypothetical protein
LAASVKVANADSCNSTPCICRISFWYRIQTSTGIINLFPLSSQALQRLCARKNIAHSLPEPSQNSHRQLRGQGEVEKQSKLSLPPRPAVLTAGKAKEQEPLFLPFRPPGSTFFAQNRQVLLKRPAGFAL